MILCSWLCLLFILDLSIGCVSHSFQNVPFYHHSFWPCSNGFLTFPCLWEISFSSQMISGAVGFTSLIKVGDIQSNVTVD